ncbi:Ig-like domain-containing protein, partial [uncultured Eudoraea sp.]|uniref:Ig-like domain-containing protein n=1 Tax=uncultured Eudoraea sp. TaxID=1035614 RepID=UPI00262119EF
NIFYDFETQASASTTQMAAQIEQSTVSNKLWIIAGGPMETVWRGLNMASQGHEHVTVISHSAWNEGHVHCSDDHDWNDLLSDFIAQGVFFVGNCSNGGCNDPSGLNDQNGGFSSSPSNWEWMDNSSYEYNQWIFSRNPFGNKIDPSDAGMSYFLITGGPFDGGNKTPDHNDARQLMENPCDDPGQETNSNSSGGNCNYNFEEVNGRVIIQAESIDTPGGWQKNSSSSEYTGNGYLEWTGGDSFASPGNGTTSTSIKINQPGTYKFQWRTKVGHGSNATEANDSWLRFPDADDFFGQKENGHIVYPKGSGKSPNPNGAGADNWFKVYVNNLSWTWSTHTSDNDGHEIYVTFDSPGVYTMQLSGRSDHHLIDRMVLALDPQGSTQLSLEETICTSSDPDPVAVNGINVSPSHITIEVGENYQLNAQISPTNATNQAVNWSFEDESVASVSPQGVVSGIDEGTTTITVTSVDGNFAAQVTVEVIAAQEENNEEENNESPGDQNDNAENENLDNCSADYMEVNNRIVIEAESLNYDGDWSLENDIDGYTGTGYLEWLGEDQFQSPTTGTINASIQIQNPGTYLFQWHSKVGLGSNTTESNDTWLRFPDADGFYGEKSNGSKVFPRGSGQTPLPNGAGADGWFKVYSSGGNTDWTWSTYTSDNDGHFIYVTFDSPGVYTMELAARSKGHFIDRITLSKSGVDGTDLNLSPTQCAGEEAEEETQQSKPNLLINNASVYEGGKLEFNFTLSEPLEKSLELRIEVVRGTAHNADFVYPEDILLIPAGETSAMFTIQTKKDNYNEGDETLILNLIDHPEEDLNEVVSTALGTILDDDIPMGIYPNPATANQTVDLNGILQGTYEVTLFSMSGEMIKKQVADIHGNFEYMVPNINEGLYIIRADNSEKSYSGKLAVN